MRPQKESEDMMHDDTISSTKNITAAPLKFNADEYKEHLSSGDLTEAQKAELLQNLWHIMESFVHMGWGVDNMSLFFPEIFNNAAEKVAPDSQELLESNQAPKGEK